MTQVSIPTEAMSTIVTKAMLDHLTPEVREEILSKAITDLLTAGPRDYYGKPQPSPLQATFNTAVMNVAREVAEEVVQESDFKAKIKEKLTEAMHKAASDDLMIATALGDAVAIVVGKALRGELH